MDIDDLVVLLRARAADPDRRVDAPETEFGATLASMGVADMFKMAGGLAGRLNDVVAANQAGRALDPDMLRSAEGLASAMSTPIASALPPPATVERLTRAEQSLGQPLPESVRRIYAEVADGGFGPGAGLLSIDEVVSTYRDLVADPPAPRGMGWPLDMAPLVAVDPGFYCLELPGGRVVDWDPEGVTEFDDANGWAASFREIAPDVQTWLVGWVVSRTPAEERADQMAQLRRDAMRETRERIAAMTPAERAAAGLPEEGWEDALISDD